MTEFAGNLRERVVLETRLEARDARGGATGKYSYDGVAWASHAADLAGEISGGATGKYSNDGVAWASLMPLIPADLARADALSALPRWQVTIRKREGVGIRTRLTWRGKYLAVRGLVSDPRQPAQMLLTCEEVR